MTCLSATPIHTCGDLLALLLELSPEDLAQPITVLDYHGMQVFPAVVEAEMVPEYVPEHPGEGDPYPASLMLTVNKT